MCRVQEKRRASVCRCSQILTGFGAISGSGTFDFENKLMGGNAIILTGSQIAAVPLPAGLPLLAGGLMLMGIVRRRRG
ncbi:hypothetical protein C1J03_05195 [Sulfitobacter sp. SK012]|nr:hypothetical protein C1J03_05195 [Sulfitobacter sp. SK012]